MHRFRLIFAQRLILVIGLGVALFFVGCWATSLGAKENFGWVAYAPLSKSAFFPPIGGLHPWVRLVIWLLLTLVWMGLALALLREKTSVDIDRNGNDEN
jgi:heme/copper-type cytochrome/quinol oxidase subunit 1